MRTFTWDQVVRITEEYNELDTALYRLAKILQELGYEKFQDYARTGKVPFVPTWFVNEIETLDPSKKTIEVEFRALIGDQDELITVKIPFLWLQLEDPREEIKFQMELAN